MPGRRDDARTVRGDDAVSERRGAGGVFEIGVVPVAGRPVRVGRQAGSGARSPLLMFNGIGGNIEMLAPLAARMPGREVILFDVPGVGHSAPPAWPYRLRDIARLAAAVLDHFGHERADVLGISWGGAAAQQFARSCAPRCRRLVLCATATGAVMVPGDPRVTLKMVTPRRFLSPDYARRVAGDLYGGDIRRDPGLAVELLKHVRWQSRRGYYLQIAAIAGWTSVHWLRRIVQPTLILAGADDPLVPLVNARLMHGLLPHSELKVFDCGHLFVMTRGAQTARVIDDFLDCP